MQAAGAQAAGAAPGQEADASYSLVLTPKCADRLLASRLKAEKQQSATSKL